MNFSLLSLTPSAHGFCPMTQERQRHAPSKLRLAMCDSTRKYLNGEHQTLNLQAVCAPTWSGSTVSTSGSCIASALMQRMSKPYTLSQKSIFSCLRQE